ncbi:hypothetical protein [Phenylobacterium sp.]|uniref:hypothetical protein n=1 Tax=Phenylobacterium sp. TaxID=1871053 RepID=UPI0027232380|nr:hypothetical protein [Phenylobacterium sp.]MDO8378200.1 hypothetical protein [Phenylobacterium sp.]
MTAILYPVAADAEAALKAPIARCAREREAAGAAREAVVFVTEPVGPPYASREAALDAHAGKIEDERPGHVLTLVPEDRYCRLAEVIEGRPPVPAQPTLEGGRRWPAPKAPPRTAWRLQVSYWRLASAVPRAEGRQARQARKQAREPLDYQALNALARQPMRAVRPQQPLDIGLFETRPPEAPHIIMPDE